MMYQHPIGSVRFEKVTRIEMVHTVAHDSSNVNDPRDRVENRTMIFEVIDKVLPTQLSDEIRAITG